MLKGARILVLLATVVGVAATARLGLWQLDRAAQKQALQAQRDAQAHARALSAVDLPTTAGRDTTTLLGRRVQLQGRWMVDATVYLDNRPLHGQPGFAVLTPLLLADGRAIVVLRGWLPRDAADRTRIAPYHTPEALVEVSGRVAPPPSRQYELGAEVPGPIRQNLDLERHGREIRRPLEPITVVQEPTAAGPADGLRRDWPPPTSDMHKNYGYAFQWFALSALIAVLYVWFQFIRPRRAGTA